MPVIQRKGAQSSQGFGEFAQSSTAANYIEDYFSTYLYTGTGATQTINNGIGLADTAAWSSYKLQQNGSVGNGVTTDSSGNFYVTGYASDLINVYIIIAKYNSSGVLQWQRKLQQSSSIGQGITTDSSGNVYVTGSANDGLNGYIITAKYNSSGTIQWQRKLLQSDSSGNGITTDSSGNVYITGYADDGSAYIIVAKYNSSGTLQWQRKLRQNGSVGNGIATDSSGNVYVTGLANDGTNYYIIVAKYDSSGVIQWQRKLKESDSYGYGITVDSSGNIYVTGYAQSGGVYLIIAKYNSSGVIQWQRKLKQGTSIGHGVTTDASGNVYVTGRANDGTQYIIVAKYNSSGTLQWQSNLKQGTSKGSKIATDSSGNVYVTGYANDGTNDYIVTSKLKQDGTTTSGTAFVTMIPSSATDSAGTATESAAGATDSAAGATDSAAGATDSAGATTATSATQAAVTGGGGLVWLKYRSGTNLSGHELFDTLRGTNKFLASNQDIAEQTPSNALNAFNANGFTLGGNTEINYSGTSYASWTFRKQAKFFDIVTYTGNGVTGRNVAHNLTSTPGFIIVKRTDTTADWKTFHTYTGVQMALNLTAIPGPTAWAGGVINSCTSTTFQLGDYGGSLSAVNASGGTYVAYLFAHNAGGFGSAGTDNVISCGSMTLDGSGNATANLGYEPQFVLYKMTSAADDWRMLDTMRGLTASNGANTNPYALLRPNTSGAEGNFTGQWQITSTGLQLTQPGNAGQTYIYIAIRRGPMKTPTSGTSVFTPTATSAATGTAITTNFTVDMQLYKTRGSIDYWFDVDRLRGVNTTTTGNSTFWLDTSSTAAEAFSTTVSRNWGNTGVEVPGIVGGASNIFYSFQRAPGFFDEVCYTGTGVAGNINHNLGVSPEFMIFKSRNASFGWAVSIPSLGTNRSMQLQSTLAAYSSELYTTSQSTTTVTLTNESKCNASGNTFVAYLFATCPGVSKVGSYTGTGALQTVNCGFTSGARFVLIKRTDSTGDWYVWDSARGISSGNDPYLLINSTAAEVTGTNYVDTDTTGFKVTAAAPAGINANGGNFIFLAVA